MNKTKKIVSFFLLLSSLTVLLEPLQAHTFDIYDGSGDFTTTGLIACAFGGAAVGALGYDAYQTYYIPHKDREKTFIENFSTVAQNTVKYLKSAQGIEDGAGVLFTLSYAGAATYLSMYVMQLFQSQSMDITVLKPEEMTTKFDDVAGLDDAKISMKDIVNYLKYPEKYQAMGAPAPKGVLMYGGPGNGKTLLARAVAGEVNCSFISMTGSSFIEMYVGTGAARVRKLFATARKQGPCIIFIDEIDALITKRNDGNSEQNQTVAAFLAEVDGLQDNKYPIVIIGATNRLEAIDRPAIRPGRFDRHIEIKKPTTIDRETLLKINLHKINHDSSINISAIAEMTSGFSGADLTNLVNQAALVAVNDESKYVEMHHVKKAFDTIKDSMMTTIDASYQLDIAYPGDITTTFENIAGLSVAKSEVKELVDYLKDSTKYDDMGIKVTKGILFSGAPGNGKTSLARAIAGEANCPFISVTGSSFIEKYVGTGAARVRELFEKARKEAPCIIFIDEIDALLSRRSNDAGVGGDQERNQTVAEFLAQVDGLKHSKKPIIIIGATNRLQALDESAIRPGRFDCKIHISNPSAQDRFEMLQMKLQQVNPGHDVNFDQIAQIAHMADGFSGADITHLINESARLAMKNGSSVIHMSHVEQATENTTSGLEEFDVQLNSDDKSILAFRKAGRVLGLVVGNKDIVQKVSIRPRINSLGFVRSIPLQESIIHKDAKARTDIRMLLCEHLGEQAITKNENKGQSTDFAQARKLAYSMIQTYGIPDKYARNAQQQLKTTEEVLSDIMNEEYKQAETIIKNHSKDLKKVADALLDKETLSGQDIYMILGKDEPKKLGAQHDFKKKKESL